MLDWILGIPLVSGLWAHHSLKAINEQQRKYEEVEQACRKGHDRKREILIACMYYRSVMDFIGHAKDDLYNQYYKTYNFFCGLEDFMWNYSIEEDKYINSKVIELFGDKMPEYYAIKSARYQMLNDNYIPTNFFSSMMYDSDVMRYDPSTHMDLIGVYFVKREYPSLAKDWVSEGNSLESIGYTHDPGIEESSKLEYIDGKWVPRLHPVITVDPNIKFTLRHVEKPSDEDILKVLNDYTAPSSKRILYKEMYNTSDWPTDLSKPYRSWKFNLEEYYNEQGDKKTN